jgi:uncharacterized membrane protein (DUF4010 family)
MFPRMLVVVAAVAPDLVVPLLAPMLTAAIAAYATAAWYAWGAGPGTTVEIGREPQNRNPLDLGMAVRFGLLLAAIMFLAKGASQLMGHGGLYGLAAVSGLADVDAITLSAATMSAHGEIAASVASVAILIVAAVNTAVKAIMVAAICGTGMGSRVGVGLALALLAGAIALRVSALL